MAKKRNYRAHEKAVKLRLGKPPSPKALSTASNLTAVRLDYSDSILTGNIRFVKQRVSADPVAIEEALDTFLDALGIE